MNDYYCDLTNFFCDCDQIYPQENIFLCDSSTLGYRAYTSLLTHGEAWNINGILLEWQFFSFAKQRILPQNFKKYIKQYMSYLDSPIPSLLELSAQRLLNKNGWSIHLYSRKSFLLSSSPHYFQGSWRIFFSLFITFCSIFLLLLSLFCLSILAAVPFPLHHMHTVCTRGMILGHTLRYAKHIFYFLKKSWWYSSLVQVSHFTSLPNSAVW